MSDELRLRNLLLLATDLPDDVRPPVQAMIRAARDSRRRRMRFGAIAAGLVTALACCSSRDKSRCAPRPAPTLPCCSANVGPAYVVPSSGRQIARYAAFLFDPASNR